AVAADGTTDLEGTRLTVKLTYDQNIKSNSFVEGRISINNEAVIEKIYAYMAVLSIDITGLESGQQYTLTVPDGLVEGYKENQKAAQGTSLTFSMKYVKPKKDYELDPVTELSNRNATAQAKNVYRFLLEQSGKKMLTGVQSEGTANNNDHVNLIYSKTGKHPALAGYDFIFLQYSPTPEGWSWVVNYSDMSAPIEHWNAGGLVNYMWHWNVPNSKSDWENGVNKGDFSGYAFYSDKTSFSIVEALKDGTWQHDFIMKDIEKVAGYLKILQDASIPVIWRPLHEAAGNYNLYGKKNNAWFWWGRGGAEPCKQLYRLMRDTFEKEYELNNLIWVWTLDATAGAEGEWADWYPGDEYVDIVGVDIYEDNTNAKIRQYQACVNLSEGRKLVTVSECGNIPDPTKCFEAGNKWNWFLVWSSGTADYHYNTDAYWKQVMSDKNTIAREDMPSLK
ncbi:MAG: hypothetical protein MJY57_01515, partial [Bacteroidales bacterium]|nr:hypothetical protein [Bacteroidales bacterium]